MTEEAKEKLRARNRARTGWKHTEKTKIAFSKKMKGRPKPPGFGDMVRARQTGFKHGPESIAKMCRQQSLEGNARWKGGEFITELGYVLVKDRAHPFRKKNNYVHKHRLVMEKHLGRFLEPAEVVHHINHDCGDNRIENLMLFPNGRAHLAFHREERKRVSNTVE